MSNPTSNFGWQMPTPTDLVTDLPADFEVFGQAVDSSLADLKGGTTGQVLSKNSNTDMDFVWVTDAAGDITGVTAGTGISGGGTSGTVTITNSMATEITAKGDLIVGTGSATFDNLAAGADGSSIVADSAATTGLRYQATPSASNPVINSAFQIWQRGTSMAGGANGTTFCADRWNAYATGSTTFSRQVTGDTTNLPNIQYCARVSRDSGTTGTGVIIINQNFETVNTIPFVGKTVTMSFYARKGANYSMASSNILSQLTTGTGTDQSYITTGYTGEVALISQNSTLTTTWQRFTYTATVASNVTEMSMQWRFTPVGTAGAADYFEITGVQLDIGNVALPYRTYAATIQGELAACQRYYYRVSGTTAYNAWGTGIGASNVLVSIYAPLPVTMRTTPTTLDSSTLAVYDTGTVFAVTSPTINGGESGTGMVTVTCTTSGTTQYRPYKGMFNNSSSAFIGFGAEL